MGESQSRFLQARITRRWMFCQGDVQLVCWRRAKQEEGWTFISTMGQPSDEIVTFAILSKKQKAKHSLFGRPKNTNGEDDVSDDGVDS